MSSDKNFLITISIILLIVYFIFNINLLIFISVFLFVIAFIKPNLMHILNYIVFRLGLLFLALVQPVILRFIYVLVFGVVALIMKLFKYDPFKLKQKNQDTFWQTRQKQVEGLEDIKNQF